MKFYRDSITYGVFLQIFLWIGSGVNLEFTQGGFLMPCYSENEAKVDLIFPLTDTNCLENVVKGSFFAAAFNGKQIDWKGFLRSFECYKV